MLLEVSSKFWNHCAIMLAGGGPVKAATQMRKLNSDLAANLLQVVEMVVVPPSPSWHPSCSELPEVLHQLLLASGLSPPKTPMCHASSGALLVNWAEWQPAGVQWLTQGPKLQTLLAVSFYSEFLLFCGEAGFFGNTVPSVTWAGVGKLQVVGSPKLALEKVHQAQLWSGWRVTGGVPLLHGCDITQF